MEYYLNVVLGPVIRPTTNSSDEVTWARRTNLSSDE